MKMLRILIISVFSFIMLSSCAAMMQAYEAQVDKAVVLSNVDQAPYKDVMVDKIACTGDLCDSTVSMNVSSKFATELSRIGFTVHDKAKIQELLEEQGLYEGDVKVNLDTGFLFSGNGGGATFSVTTVPQETRTMLYDRAGIKAVISGYYTISAPDEITQFRTLHMFVKSVDISTGAVVWQGEWKENIFENGQTAQPAQKAVMNIAKSLARNLAKYQYMQ